MGHYCIAVFHRRDSDLNDLLAPYSLDNYEHEEFQIEYRKEDAEILFQEFKSESKENSDLYNNIKYFMTTEHCCDKQDEDGNFGFNTNPKGMYDYFTIGGRWAGTLYGELTEAQMREKQDECLKDKSKFRNEVAEYMRLRMLSPEDYCAEKELLGHTTIACEDFDAKRTVTMTTKRHKEPTREIGECFYSVICEDGGLQNNSNFKSLLKYWTKKKGYITTVDFHM